MAQQPPWVNLDIDYVKTEKAEYTWYDFLRTHTCMILNLYDHSPY